MNGAYRPFRLLKKRQTGIMYIAIADMLEDFRVRQSNSKTPEEEATWQELIDAFSKMIYEGLDHDL